MSSNEPSKTPHPTSQEAPPPPVRQWQLGIIAIITFAFLVLPFRLGYSVEVLTTKFANLGWEGFFYVLALLPGAVGVIHHIVSAPARRMKVQRLAKRYSELQSQAIGTGSGGESDEDNAASVVNACAASLLLTGVFLVVAVVIDTTFDAPEVARAKARAAAAARASQTQQSAPPVTAGAGNRAGQQQQNQDGNAPAGGRQGSNAPRTDDRVGLIFAGLGAYVAVLYYMAGRLYANALSSRFLATSALRSASAIALGYVLSRMGTSALLPSANSATAAFFLIGLFHNWAMNAMRTKALTLLGAPKSDNEELPITIVEGIEDTSADLLSEYGVSTVQHLALIDAGDLSQRTLIPLDRVLDWTDQAILIQRIKRSVASTRSVGVRTATDFARQYLRKSAGDDVAKNLLASIAEKSGMGMPAIETTGRELVADCRVKLIYKTLQSEDLVPAPEPAATFDAEVDRSLSRYTVVAVEGDTPAGRLQVKKVAPPPAG